MQKDIHPPYYPQATVTCLCGHAWTTGSTKPSLKIEICSRCHPFYTGKEKLLDTAGRVDRFRRLVEKAKALDTKKGKAPRPPAAAEPGA